MNRIVHGSIKKIAEQKPRKKCESIFSHDKEHYTKYSCSKNQAWNGRHEQSLPVAWILVMVTMQHIRNSSAAFAFRNPVKDEPMRHVFE